MSHENRAFTIAAFEVRKGSTAEARTVVGHAAVFNTPTTIGKRPFEFREQIRPGAFAKAIKTDDVAALFNHNPDNILGRTSAGTLRLAEDARGLAFEIDLPDTTAGRDLAISLERGDVKGVSFGFDAIVDEWDDSSRDMPTRTLIEVRLFDVSPVVYPAYPATDAALRSWEGFRGSASSAAHASVIARKRRQIGLLRRSI